MIPYEQFDICVSTHSRPKAAGLEPYDPYLLTAVSTHSRPKAAGWSDLHRCWSMTVSTHSRPKAAGFGSQNIGRALLFQHTAARRRLAAPAPPYCSDWKFQHTAARRRLGFGTARLKRLGRFNTQPPEGGWRKDLIRAEII